MADDSDDLNDQIWRPGYAGPTPLAQPIRLAPDTEASSGDDDPPPPQRFTRRWLVGIVAAVAVGIASLVLATRFSQDDAESAAVDPAVPRDELPDVVAASGEPFAGANPKQLPRALDSIWTQEIQADTIDDVWVEVVDRRFALVAVGDNRASTGVLRSVDAETGTVNWSTVVSAPPRAMQLVAASADAIALVIAEQLIGFDVETGEEVWRFTDQDPVFDGAAEPLAGTDLIAVRSPDGSSTLVDITSGDTVGQFDGPTIADDRLGTSYVRRGTDIIEYDLSGGFSEPTLVATDINDAVVTLVDRSVLASAPAGWRVSDPSDDSSDRVIPDGADDFPVAASIVPMLGSTFVVAGAGSVIGAHLDDQTMRLGWRRNGVLTDVYPTERGYLVHTASNGGATQTIYDGRTGDLVLAVTMAPGWSDSLEIVGNGIVTRQASRDGSRLAGLDLDGVEIWSIKGVAAAAVGDRLVVTTIRLDDGSIQLDALGEPERSRPG